MTKRTGCALVALIFFSITSTLVAQRQRQNDPVALKAWPAPLFWQPTRTESDAATGKVDAFSSLKRDTTVSATGKADAFSSLGSDATVSATIPAGALVFVAMTPCRIADTRNGTFPTGFGPPTLSGGATRTFAIQSPSSICPVPSVAQAYSFNITVVPPGATFPGNVNPSGALTYLTIWPTGVPQPVVSTLNNFLGTVVANAAIVPAGTSGSVDVFVSHSTDFIVDINGYYAPLSAITLAQGTSATPSLSFASDPGTGIFSSTAGTLNMAAGGVSAISVKNGGNVGIGTDTPNHRLSISGGPAWTLNGWAGAMSLSNGSAIGWESNVAGQRAGIGHSNGGLYFFRTVSDPGTIGSLANYDMLINDSGNVGIGTTNPQSKLHVEVASSDTAVYGYSLSGFGVVGTTLNGDGVYGSSDIGVGVKGFSTSGYGVYGSSSNNWAGFFAGNVRVSGQVVQGSDARLKQDVASLSYGLREVLRLRPVTWNWKAKPDGGRQLGLIAQEVETVLPELVTTDKDAEQTKGLSYIGLVPVTIKAIQEQQTQIEDQRKVITEQQDQIRHQQEQNRKLEERLEALERMLSMKQPTVASQ